MPSINKTYFGTQFGLDLFRDVLSSDRPIVRALETDNVVSRRGGGVEKKKGHQVKSDSTGGFGLFNYVSRGISSGSVSEELLTVDDSLYKLTQGTLNVTYTGSSDSARLVMRVNGSTPEMELLVYEGNTLQTTESLGNGFDESSPVTISTTSTNITAISADFTSTVTGESTTPSAFLDLTTELIIPSGESGSLPFFYWEVVNSPISNPLSTYLSSRNNDDFVNVSAVNHKNVMYFAFGEVLHKYDGQTFYKAGLNRPLDFDSITKVGSGSLTGDYTWSYTYRFTDNQGNTVESQERVSDTVTLSSEDADLRMFNLRDTTGFNTGCALASSTQAVAPSSGIITLSVDDGSGGTHTLKAGDTAYLLNRATGSYVTKPVASVTTTTITLTSTESINVTNNDVISNNLRISLYRTVAGGANRSLVAEVPNNSFIDTQVYTDSTVDANLGARFLDPLITPSPPPVCSFVTSYQDNLILGDGFTLSYSDEGNVDASSEVFPLIDNSVTIFSDKGGVITGLGTSGDTLTIFGEESIFGIEGDLTNDNFRVFKISDHIGCISHSTIQNVGSSLFFLDVTGVFSITQGRLTNINSAGVPIAESILIDPIFKVKASKDNQRLNLKRAVAVNDVNNNRYIIHLPAESTHINRYSNNHSKVFCYEYDLQNWFEWSKTNLTGGSVIHNDRLWWIERAVTATESEKLHRQSDSETLDDYYHHTDPIRWKYVPGWESLGDLSTPKKALWLKVHSLQTTELDFQLNFTLDVRTERDLVIGLNHSQLTLSFNNSGMKWGDPWGTPWGAFREPFLKTKLKSGKTRSIRPVFENNEGGQNVVVSGWEIHFGLPYNITIKDVNNTV